MSIMGLYDNLRCAMPLPLDGANDRTYQTKDTPSQEAKAKKLESKEPRLVIDWESMCKDRDQAIEELEAERDKMRESLEFYAKEEHWATNLGGEGIGAAHDDQGSRARAALGLPTDFRKLNG